MDTAVFLLLYITTLVATTWFSFIAAATDIGTPNVPTTHSPDGVSSGKDIHYDVTTMAPKDFLQSETLPMHVPTTDLPSDTVSENSEEPLVHTLILTHASGTNSAEEHRTVPYEEGALGGITASSVERTFETSSAVSLTELRNRRGDEFQTTSSSVTEDVTVIEYTEKSYETTASSGQSMSSRRTTSTGRRRTGVSSTSSEVSKKQDFEDGNDHENGEIPEAPVHRHRNEGLVTEANINHAALWITVAFVAVLLVYITVLIIYNAKKRDWHQSLPPYTRFVEETTPEDQEAMGTLDRMLQRITGKKNTEDGYSLSF